MKVKTLSHVRLSHPMDCSLPGSSIHGIFQARVREWVVIAFSEYNLNTPNSLSSEKAMAPYSSTLAWKIPWMEEPGRLQSMGSLSQIRLSDFSDLATSLSLFTFMHWRRKWQPTPVFLPRESQGQGSLVGCRLWSRRVGHD